jgi:AraC family transcriptional regulator
VSVTGSGTDSAKPGAGACWEVIAVYSSDCRYGATGRMQILSNKSANNGFRANELREIVPEVVDLGERWESAGSREQPHQHRYWEIGYAAEGACELTIGKERKLRLRPGSFWSVPAGTVHWLHQGAQSRHQRLFVGLQLPAIAARHAEWNLKALVREVVVLHEVRQLELLFSRIVTEGATPSYYQAAALRLGVDALLLEIVRATTDGNGKNASVVTHPAVSRALTALQNRFRESWTLQSLAKESGISRARLAQLFRQQLGSSIHKVLNEIRVEHARNLLKESGLSVSEISQDCGFATSQHFARVFRDITGSTAAAYRRELAALK